MKNLIEIIKESNDKETALPTWADFLCIDLGSGMIEFFKVKDVKNSNALKLKVGESYYDKDFIWICVTDLSALSEK